MHKRVYLDYAAAVPPTKNALKAFVSAVAAYGNPSAAHTEGRAAKALLEEARKDIARLGGSKPEMVIFTSGATEANAIAIRGYVRAQIKKGVVPGDLHLIYSAGAHASIMETMDALKEEGIAVDVVPLKDGDIDLDALKSLIRPQTVLVSIEAVSAETGARYNTRGVRNVLEGVTRLHVDASQLPRAESFERTRLSADLISLDAQKVGGVRGIGCLIVAPNVSLEPVIDGGGQERGLRSGTESVAHAKAFAQALTETAQTREKDTAHALRMREYLTSTISSAIGDAVVNEGKENVPHILNMSFPGRDTDYLAALLDERGFAVSTRSACETDSVNGSRTVLALTGDTDRAKATLRISWGRETKEADLKAFTRALIESVAFIDRNPA